MSVVSAAHPAERRPRLRRPLAALLTAIVVLGAARLAVGVTFGLQGEYFTNDRLAAPPVLRVVDRTVSTDRVTRNWVGVPPPAFSVRWFGYLTIRRPGQYTFALRSDDGATLRIDGRVIVDNSGRHGAITRSATTHLEPGAHFVLLEYGQEVGDYEIAWLSGLDDGPLSPVSPATLSTSRAEPWRLSVAWWLEWLVAAAAALGTVLLALATVRERGAIARAVRARPRAATLGLFGALAVVHTWPLASHPARLSRNDNADTILNEWTLAWLAHQAPRDPLRLYDANIFYPEPNTLAYSESLMVQGAMAAPLQWLGASPVLAYNIVLLAGFTLTGWAVCAVLARWTGDWTAGIAAGMVAAFNAHTLTRLPHLQVQHGEFLPFALVALDALLREPRTRHAVQLAAWFTLHALTSMYFLVFGAFALTAAAASRPRELLGARTRAVLPRIALAAALAAAALLPFLLPYWRLFADQGVYRPLVDAGRSAASWQHYLSTPARLHYEWWSHRWFTGIALFPGAAALVLAAIAIGRGVAFRDPRARMCLAFGVTGVVLSLGTRLPSYELLYEIALPLRAIRDVSRFGYLAILAVAALAGFGLAAVRQELGGRPRAALSAAALALITMEAAVAPIGLTRFDGIPHIYERVNDTTGAVVIELPFYASIAAFHQAPYMLNSTRHWQPIVNGYSGLQPASFHEHAALFAGFPGDASIAAIRAAGVTHLFVHLQQYGAADIDRLNRTPALTQIATEGGIGLYRVNGAPASELGH